MIELLSIYAPAVIGMVGIAMGALVGRRSRPRPPEPLRPICSCTNGYGSHEGGKACRAQAKQADHWDMYRAADHWTYVACPCVRYDGPSPSILGLDVS